MPRWPDRRSFLASSFLLAKPASWAPAADALPSVASAAARDALFRPPRAGQKCYRQDQGVVEEFSGSSWVPILTGARGVIAEGNPLNYGADGTGATAATRALRLADAVGELFIPPRTTLRVDADLTIAGNVRFANGGKLRPDRGVTITFAGMIHAAHQQIFDLGAGGSIAIGATNDVEVNPIWFGARPDYFGGDSTAAFQKCFASGAKRVFVPWGQYDVREPITAGIGGRVVVRGDGLNSSIYFNPSAPNQALFRSSDSDNLIFRDLAVTNGKRSLERITAFDFNAKDVSQVVFEGIYIQGFTEFGVRLRDTQHAYFRRCRFMDMVAPAGKPAHAVYVGEAANHVEFDNCRFHNNDKIARIERPSATVFRNCSSEQDGAASVVPRNYMIEVSEGSTFSWLGGYVEAPRVGDGYAFIGFTGPMRSCAIRDTFFDGSLGSVTHTTRFLDVGAGCMGVTIDNCRLAEVRSTFVANSSAAPVRIRGCTFRQAGVEKTTHNDVMAVMTGSLEFDNLWQSAPWAPRATRRGDGETSPAIRMAGAAPGDALVVSFDRDLGGQQLTAWIEREGVVRARLQNVSGTGRIAEGALRFRLLKKD